MFFLCFILIFILLRIGSRGKFCIEVDVKEGFIPLCCISQEESQIKSVKFMLLVVHLLLGGTIVQVILLILLLRVISSNKLPFVSKESPGEICDACQMAKNHHLPYSKSNSISKAPLELIFSDVWGSAPLSVGRYTYYVSFIDDFSKYTWIYLLKRKSDVFRVLQEFQNLVERKFDRKLWLCMLAQSSSI